MQKKYKTYDFFLLVKFARKKIFEEVRKNNREKARIGVSRSAKENLSRPANYFRNDCNKKKTNQPAWLQSASAWYGVHGQQQERKPSYFLLLFVATVVYGASISSSGAFPGAFMRSGYSDLLALAKLVSKSTSVPISLSQKLVKLPKLPLLLEWCQSWRRVLWKIDGNRLKIVNGSW